MGRRTYLKSLCPIAGSVLVSGCLGSNSAEKITVTSVAIINWADEEGRVELRTELDGTVVHDNVYSLSAHEAANDSHKVLIQDLPERPGQYHLVGSIIPDNDDEAVEQPALDYKPQSDVDGNCRTVSIGLHMNRPPWGLSTTTKKECGDN